MSREKRFTILQRAIGHLRNGACDENDRDAMSILNWRAGNPAEFQRDQDTEDFKRYQAECRKRPWLRGASDYSIFDSFSSHMEASRAGELLRHLEHIGAIS